MRVRSVCEYRNAHADIGSVSIIDIFDLGGDRATKTERIEFTNPNETFALWKNHFALNVTRISIPFYELPLEFHRRAKLSFRTPQIRRQSDNKMFTERTSGGRESNLKRFFIRPYELDCATLVVDSIRKRRGAFFFLCVSRAMRNRP